jgi:hypothetical protein
MRAIPIELQNVDVIDDDEEAARELRETLGRFAWPKAKVIDALVGIVTGGLGEMARSLTTGCLIIHLHADEDDDREKWLAVEPGGIRVLL